MSRVADWPDESPSEFFENWQEVLDSDEHLDNLLRADLDVEGDVWIAFEPER